jgi:signal transduction histidine kinase
MTHKAEQSELVSIAEAFGAISKEISYEGLARTLLKVALEHSGAVRGAVLLSEGGELFARADSGFPREKAKAFVSQPAIAEFQLSEDLRERVLTRQESVVRYDSWKGPALADHAECLPGRELTLLCLPLIHQRRTVGVLCLESERKQEAFTTGCISTMSMLASQAAVSFASMQLFEALRETNMLMVRGQQISRMGSYRWNTRTLLWRATRECYRIFGIDLNINPVPFEIFRRRVHPDDLPAVERALGEAVSTRSPFNHEYRVVHDDGTTLHVVAVGQFDLGPSGDVELEGVIKDVTGRKVAEQALSDAQAELAKAARLASLGELAGSIIHEINQMVTGIIASAEASLRWLARNPMEIGEARKSIRRIIEQGGRASNVVSGLRSLVRNGHLQLVELRIHEVIEQVLLFSKRDLEAAGIALKTDLDIFVPDIEADRLQLQQVILNLVRNAIDAMISLDERARLLTVSSRVVDDEALVTIADTGVGVDPAVREHIFDALCTTKDGGLGLGLSICRKIIDAHGGRLWVEKSTNQGATFAFAVPMRQPTHRSQN